MSFQSSSKTNHKTDCYKTAEIRALTDTPTFTHTDAIRTRPTHTQTHRRYSQHAYLCLCLCWIWRCVWRSRRGPGPAQPCRLACANLQTYVRCHAATDTQTHRHTDFISRAGGHYRGTIVCGALGTVTVPWVQPFGWGTSGKLGLAETRGYLGL